MPTQKDLKATRKLKRRATKTNNRRRNIGKQPLSFKHFYKTSRFKRPRTQFDADSKTQSQSSPIKKRKINETESSKPKNTPFGFGANLDENDADYQRFVEDINDSDSEDINSDNDIIESATEAPLSSAQLTEKNEQIKQQIKEHQSALESLKNADPDFYKHLSEMDNGNLLSFGDSDQFNLGNLGDLDETVDAIQNNENEQTLQQIKGKNDTGSDNEDDDDDDDLDDFMDEDGDNLIDDIVDDTMFEFELSNLETLIANIENDKSALAMKQIMDGFCYFVELTLNDKKQSVLVAHNIAFQELLRYCLTKLGKQIKDILKITNKQELEPKLLQTNKHFIAYKSTFIRYFKFLYAFFKGIDDESMRRLFCQHCTEFVHFLLSMNEAIKRLFIKQIVKFWCSGKPNVRCDAFIFLHNCGKRMHAGKNGTNERELLQLLKIMYTSFVTVCKRVSKTTMPGIKFLMNCLVEMYDINPVISYKDAFKRLRSIAFHCKQSIQIMAKHSSKNVNAQKNGNKLKQKQQKLETVQSVYNWRFINIICLWSKVLAAHSNKKNSDLHLLHYPFVQICCSVLTLTRSAAYNPGRLKIMRSLCDFIEKCQKSQIMDRRIYVPLAPYLISILNNPAFGKKNNEQKKKKQKKQEEGDEEEVFEMSFKIKISDAHFNTLSLHEALLNESVRLMLRFFSFYSCAISFPELSFPTLVFLKEFAENPNIDSLIKAKVKIVSVKLRENANWIVLKRKGVDFSPKDFEKVSTFLAAERLHQSSPLAKFVKSAQFEKITSSRMIVQNEEKKQRKDQNGKNEKKKNKKKKKRNKMEKKRLNKMEKEKMKKDKEIVDGLKKSYDQKSALKNVQISGVGDVVQDFELSD